MHTGFVNSWFDDQDMSIICPLFFLGMWMAFLSGKPAVLLLRLLILEVEKKRRKTKPLLHR